MRLLTVPNWSFGRDKALLRRCRELLEESGLRIHYCEADVDHNRAVTAFSGDSADVFEAVEVLAEEILPRIDLNRHIGVHPRIGGLDVCPFVSLDRSHADEINPFIDAFAQGFAERWQIPVFLYEKSEKGRHEADLPSLRKGGFGSLAGKTLRPDFGPTHAHTLLGLTVMGLRDFLIAMNVDLADPNPNLAKGIAKSIRALRSDGDERFLGVRALGLPLVSRGLSQVSMNLTLPDLTPIDPLLEFVFGQATKANVRIAGTELIGVIRRRDMEHAERLTIKPEQVVD